MIFRHVIVRLLTLLGQVVLILDIASSDQIPQLAAHFSESPFYRRFRSKAVEDTKEYTVSTIFHLCGEDVLENPQYIEFMDGFPESTNVSSTLIIESS